jgi:hypothetical protein
MDTRPPRLRARPLALIRQALGPPQGVPAKLGRLARVLLGYGRGAELDRRLGRLRARGVIDAVPTRVQLVVGSIDMLRFWISPAAAEYYRDQGISYGFHQLLRLLEGPASLADPVGFFSSRDGVIGHLMQVVHANPVYDLQLLQMFEDGLDELDRQLAAVLAGTHPRGPAIQAIVEEADYHARLLGFLRAWRRDPASPPPLRQNVAANPAWAEVERTFGTLPAAMRYFARLPAAPRAAAAHLLKVRTFPQALAEPR